MEVEVEVGTKKFKVRELLAIELDGIDWNDKANSLKKQVTLSANLSDDEYAKLTVKERLKIVQAITEINGFGDFQLPKN